MFEGTTKRKELHGMLSVHALSGTWAHRPDSVTLNAYKIHFVCDQEGENYSGFVLLIEAILDDDVASAKMELFLIPNKVVKTSISASGKIQLNADQVSIDNLHCDFEVFISCWRFLLLLIPLIISLFLSGGKIKTVPRIFFQWLIW